uniref:Uncharacterized protein n=1 Tax=Megaselia scalaris TaxID=36166 RepID=T1GSJ2_MEGSC
MFNVTGKNVVIVGGLNGVALAVTKNLLQKRVSLKVGSCSIIIMVLQFSSTFGYVKKLRIVHHCTRLEETPWLIKKFGE